MARDGDDVALIREAFPFGCVRRRLSLDVGVGRLHPKMNVLIEVVEDEISLVSPDHQNGMTVATSLTDDCNEEGARRPPVLDESAALFQHIVFAVTGVGRIGPQLRRSVEERVSHWSNCVVHDVVDASELGYELIRQLDPIDDHAVARALLR
jgi:hypothetical protein